MGGEAVSPFVGRSAEVQRIRELARTVGDGRFAGTVISAEPGLGKTRLLGEVAPLLGLPRIHLHGYEPAREIPLGAAGTLLRELAQAPRAGGTLSRLLLGEGGKAAALETVRLFEAAFRCLEELRPFALLMDDLQWADSETLALLHYLVAAAHPAGVPLFLLFASRPANQSTSFAAALGAVLGNDFLELELLPLERDAGVELASRLAPALDVDAAEAVWEKAQGSPFWVQALAGAGGRGATPLQLIRSRYAGLDAAAGRVFALLLVAAQPLGVTQLGELLEAETDDLERAIGVLISRALVVHEAGSVRIAHDLIREAATPELPETESRRLHARLAEWFEQGAGEDVVQLSRALEHRQAAGLSGGDLALRIARLPRRRLLGSEGLRMLAKSAESASDSDGLALRKEVAALALELGEWGFALERWAALVDEEPDPVRRALAALAASEAAFRLKRADELHAFVRRARDLDLDDPLLAIEADFREAQSLFWIENRVGEALPFVNRALASAELLARNGTDSLGHSERHAYVRAVRGRLDQAIREGDTEEVRRCAQLIQSVAREPAEILAAASDVAFSLLQFEGLASAAEPHAHRALAESRRLAMPSLEVEATHWVGWIAHYEGRLDEASALLHQAVALALRVGPPRRFTVPQLQAMAHSVEASRTDWRRSVSAVEDAIAAEQDGHYRIEIRYIHVSLVGRFASPSVAELRSLLGLMAEDAEAAGCGRCLWASVLRGAEAQARIGDVDGAMDALERWDAANPHPPAGPAVRRAYAAALLEAHRDPQASLPLFARAARTAGEIGHRLLALWIEIDRAVALAAVDREAGVAALRAAAHEAKTMGALSEHQLALRELRSLGVRTWRRRGDAGPLTERELEVAHLVAEGNSNREIADALFLSRKTVERHVSNILLKLGARNRTQIASRLGALQDAGAHR